MNNKTNNNDASAAADETAQTGEGNAPRVQAFKSKGNYYAQVGAFIYHLRAFASQHEALELANHLLNSWSFAPEFGWRTVGQFADAMARMQREAR
jgi:hypothetical protein